MKKRTGKEGRNEMRVVRMMREKASVAKPYTEPKEEMMEAETTNKTKANTQHLDELVRANDAITDVVELLMEKLKLHGIPYTHETRMWSRESERLMKTLMEMGAV